MKKILLTTGILFSLLYQASALDASVSFCTFKSPVTNYVEIYFHVVGKTVAFVPVDSLHQQAAVHVIVLFKRDTQIVKFDKFILNSPLLTEKKDFIDLKRYGLETGNYELEISLEDVNNASDIKVLKSFFEIDYSDARLQQSDIQLLAGYENSPDPGSPFTKMGVHMEPLPFSWYNKNMSKLFFYHEIYNSHVAIDEAFFISYSIRREGDFEGANPILLTHKRLTPAPIIPVFQAMDISTLPSGNFLLTIEVRDKSREKLSTKSVFFQRSNPYLHVDESVDSTSLIEEFVAGLNQKELDYSLRAIAPLISDKAEVLNALISDKDTTAQRMFLFAFWAKQSPNHPHQAYKKYMEIARAVDRMYQSGFGYGFETDRGYIYMKYGRPDDMISVEDDPGAPPYEIWSYNYINLTNQNNCRFLFYNPSLSPGNYILLHSTVRGEINNRQWQVELYRDVPNEIQGNNFIDATEVNDNLGRRAARYFNDF